MSIEFVDPEPDTVAPAQMSAPAPRSSAVPGRLLGAAGVVAAGLAGSAVLVSLYDVVKSSLVVDFDQSTTQVARVPYDAYGSAGTGLVTGGGIGGSDPTGPLTVSLTDGISYGRWWLGLAVLLLVVAVWALVRPRSTGPAACLAALGGVLLGSVGAAWLQIRTVADASIPLVTYAADPDAGVWLLVAAGGLALLAGVLTATRPPVRRVLRPRRRTRVRETGVEPS